ncbi:hypothetical protein, partial [Streptomyces xanthochromogenes]|uniref:hypothetical protein n=1 Tax=Streptomyces xanthochromogenes TaxID=67384 RepID=UPI003440BDF5
MPADVRPTRTSRDFLSAHSRPWCARKLFRAHPVDSWGTGCSGRFTAGAGDDLTLGVTGNTFTEAVTVNVIAPSG